MIAARLGLLYLFLSVSLSAPIESCVSRGLKAHGDKVPFEAVGSTDPNIPLDPRLFDFTFFATKTPHTFATQSEADEMAAELCGRNDLQTVILGPAKGEAEADDERIFQDILVEDDPFGPNAPALACLNDPERMCTYGDASCGTAGFDEGECPGQWRCCKGPRRATGHSGGINSDASGVVLNHNSGPSGGSNTSLAQIVGLRGSTFSASLSDLKFPIPAFPACEVGVGAAVSITQTTGSFSFSGRVTVDLGFNIKVMRVSLFVTVAGSISASSITVRNAYRSANVDSGFKTSAFYIAYGQAGAIKSAIDSVADGLTSSLKSTNTPSRPTEALRLYAEGFNQEYVDLFSDEWTFVTSESPFSWPNRPSDAVIVEALRRIERMLQTTPTQRPDGSIVWEYTASSEWLSTKLFYKMNSDNSWQWSPDNQNWMRMNEMTVRGGRWNGQKPTDDNQQTIQAIHLIYVQNPSLGNMLRDGAGSSALEVDAKDQWPQWLDNAIGSGSQALTEAGQRLVAAARRQFSNFNEFWNKIKAGIQETGAYRFVQRRFFRNDAPKKPMRVFAELAERMRVEGFGSEGLAARAFFTADAVLFRDFTRILSMRESVYAFCYKNKDIADKVGEHMDRIVAARRAHGSGARRSVFEANTDKIRIDAVKRELVARDGGQAAVAAGDEAAKRLFGKIAPELAERFEQIRTMANMVAQRLRNRGDPLWSSLSSAEKKEYSDHFLRIRGLVGNLHSFLVEVNRGDGWLKRGLLGGISYVKTQVGATMEQTKAKLRELMERDGVKVSVTVSVDVGIGFSSANPVPPGVPGGTIALQVAAQRGWVGVMDPSAFSDPRKSVSGTFTGQSGTASGSATNGANMKISVSFAFTRQVPSNANVCTALLMDGLSNCSILSYTFVVNLPGTMGLNPATVRSIALASLAAGYAGYLAPDNKWAKVLDALVGPILPGQTQSTVDPGARIELIIGALSDIVLPTMMAMANPLGPSALSLRIEVSLYWAKRNGVDVWGCSNGRIGFVFSSSADVAKMISLWSKMLGGATLNLALETGSFFDIRELLFGKSTEWPITSGPAKPANRNNSAILPSSGTATTQTAVSVMSRTLCDPERMARKLASLRSAARAGAHDESIRENLIAVLDNMERRFKARCGDSNSPK